MDAVSLKHLPSITFDSIGRGDRYNYQPYTSYFGSFYCGGNVGSMTYPGANVMNMDAKVIIYNKLVGGCNNAYIPKNEGLNSYYLGGIIGDATETNYSADRLVLNFNGPRIEPKRLARDDERKLLLNDAGNPYLEWNTVKWDDDSVEFVQIENAAAPSDPESRLYGGNIYGGCYSSGDVNGNVKININKDILVVDDVFGPDKSGVIEYNQGEDVMIISMTVFGAGMGDRTEIWGNTQINLNDAFAYQIFGGGEKGYVGKGEIGSTPQFDSIGYPLKSYAYNDIYSTTVNLRGTNAGYSEDENGPVLSEARYIYGAGNQGDVCGNSYVYLGNGRIYDAFGGASNANILGHTEIYIGKQEKDDGTFEYGFPWVEDMVFGGNDFGGKISINSTADMTDITEREVSNPYLLENVSTFVSYLQGRVDSIYAGNYGNYDYHDNAYNDFVYTEIDGVSDDSLGLPKRGFAYPYLFGNSFLYFHPLDNARNSVNYLLGGSEGFPGYVDENNTMQEYSYVLLDDVNTSAANKDVFLHTDVFGGGSYAGMGTIDFSKDDKGNEVRSIHPGAGRTTVDLFAGRFNNIYGGCNNEGLVGFSRVYVPESSTASVNAIFGGGRGYGHDVFEEIKNNSSLSQEEKDSLTRELKEIFCDHYITLVDYRSANATVEDGIYAGNHNRRLAFDTYLNITKPVRNSSGKLITVFGAGYGDETASGRTNVILQDGAQVNQVYGGGRDGYVMNYPSLTRWLSLQFNEDQAALMKYASYLNGFHTYIEGIKDPDNPGQYISPEHEINLPQDVKDALGMEKFIDDGRELTNPDKYHNTNVHILAGSQVAGNPYPTGGSANGYAYGGGLGANAIISGSTYIELKGGYVEKDIYAGGQGGPVINMYELHKNNNSNDDYLFTATSNVYIEGGQVRNVYGGGYEGHVGYHEGHISESFANDIPGQTNVVIGKLDDGTEQLSYTNGIPTITRNVYAGGEGGSVYGTAHLTINNAYIGYMYDSTLTDDAETGFDERYVENLHEKSINDTNLKGHGNAFGGGYVASSYVDESDIVMLGGYLRGSLYGGGEVGPIGRGTKLDVEKPDFAVLNNGATIYRAGHTRIRMYNGHVTRNVFGGGRGKDSWGGEGYHFEDEPDLSSKGNIFGQTEVYIYGGEIGTDKNMSQGYGNVFGGCDEGFVYSAYFDNEGTMHAGTKNGIRFDDDKEGYYYKTDGTMTEDCLVLVEPWLQVTSTDSIQFDGNKYGKGDYIPTAYLNTLPKKQKEGGQWEWTDNWNKVDAGQVDNQGNVLSERGVIIHNAVFAGGNVASGSNTMNASTTTVFGNATASINDVYHRDLVTIGTGHTGGLYGDGNLTFVDGYRELNITNYGTDYYNIDSEITIDIYNTKLSPREKAYYELRYKCLTVCTDKEGTQYRPEDGERKASTISADQLITLFVKQEGNTFVSVEDGGVAIMVQDDEGQWKPNPTYWVENGVCSRYAGRIMNTIQRADFCGVFGSRMVMQGAQDRVIEAADYTNYTINRVREVSLNKKESVIESDYDKYESGENTGQYKDENAHMHGNYFGIYSVVNYLGALTSDVDFNDIRVSDNKDYDTYRKPIPAGSDSYAYGDENATYYNWKKAHYKDNTRNNGNSHNQVALASGVYLELVTEKSTGTEFEQKDWGLITGVIELDLINVSTGVGGGFVYARNEHGERSKVNKTQVTLSALNENAVSNKMYIYSKVDSCKHGWESSGNFIHSTQTIIDDCYNIGGRYLSENAVPAHYWFVKGQVYIYDQYISAYTGASNAYSERIDLPLTITAASHGRIKLLDVKKNRYALYSGTGSAKTKLDPEQKLVINDITYRLNDPINYWEWSRLSAPERDLFVAETYTNCVAVSINNSKVYQPGTFVMTQSEYDTLAASNRYTDADGEIILDANDEPAGKDYIFRLSNNIDHDGGYILTYEVNNPALWDQWYSPISHNDGDKISTSQYNDTLNPVNKSLYYDGPTYSPIVDSIYGQREYKVADIIDQSIVNTYNDLPSQYKSALRNQATFEIAYITNEYVDAKMINPAYDGTSSEPQFIEMHLQKGARLARSEYSDDEWNSKLAGHVSPAYISTNTIKISDSQYIIANSLITEDQKSSYLNDADTDINTILDAATSLSNERKTQILNGAELTEDDITKLGGEDQANRLRSLLALKGDIDRNVVPAYYCTSEGLYGGDYYSTNQSYRALSAWSSMSEDDRSKFRFNYDALDLLIDPTYSRASGEKYQYDGSGFTTENQAKTNPAGYSLPNTLDYTATFTGEYVDESGTEHTIDNISFSYHNGESEDTVNISINKKDELTPKQFEAIPNEQRYYSRISVSETNKVGNEYKVYVVNTSFMDHDTPFAAGQTISDEEYWKLSESNRDYITDFTFSTISQVADNNIYYYCREPYAIGRNGDMVYEAGIGKSVTSALGNTTTYNVNDSVPNGFVISKATYEGLTNKQLGFIIHGVAPKEYSTLYVSRNSDIYDLSKERIITVVYQYDYEESNESGSSITAMSERHVVNIHLQFKSGIPSVDDITAPDIILPGSSLTLATPDVTPGAYEVLSSGWELFEKEAYAENHTNGREYTPMNDELYWYQDGYFLAFYAMTYLGKTYSNHVPVSVANYHDLKKVMDDKVHHLYVDYDRNDLKRDSKIYINNYTGSKNGIELFKDFYDLSLDDSSAVDDNGIITSGDFEGHSHLDNGVRGGNNLQFILRTDIDNTGKTWTPIGDSVNCFSGTLHGDGYTIKGLTASLFENLCGDVYNLGVTGTFTGAGIAERGTGYVENSWISTSSTAVKKSKPIIGKTIRNSGDYVGGSLVQIVNSYYMEDDTATNKYQLHDGSHGVAIPKSAQAFYNGEVAFNLNGFYLNKRHFDGTGQSTGKQYYYLTRNTDGTVAEDLSQAYYPDSYALYPVIGQSKYGYVEDRYADGDFRYASGIIPTWDDVRERTEPNSTTKIFAPIWPTDYQFFGQRLTYGYDDMDAHQDNPSHFNGSTNRVLRAPAYYGDSNMSKAYFNADAVLPATAKNNTDKKAYKGMTALDLSGYNDTRTDGSSQDMFFGPLVDTISLTGLRTDGLTRNLLVYGNTADTRTVATVESYFMEPDYFLYAKTPESDYNTDNDYHSIRPVSADDIQKVHGHLVLTTDKVDYTTRSDHFLVDYEDYNAPIAYNMGDDQVMWYQRKPEVFVENAGTGWDGISLPFTAQTVTTSQKGWITHFYEGSKIGHEYWLRTPDAIQTETDSETSTTISRLMFKSLSRATASDISNGKGANLDYLNTFLWDYYYNKNNKNDGKAGRDANDDIYHTYYKNTIRYNGYPFAQAATPYLIGFPGNRYYEFDMSGTFEARNTALPAPAKLDAQTITFVSAEGTGIFKSDEDYNQQTAISNGSYLFKPTYQAKEETGLTTWLLNNNGTKFENDTTYDAMVKTVPFRPYITMPAGNHASARAKSINGTKGSAIYIGYSGDQDELEEVATQGGLIIYTEDMNICVESTLEYPAEVTIMTVAGKQLKQFTIQPATKVSVPVNSRGVYIVNHQKIAVTK